MRKQWNQLKLWALLLSGIAIMVLAWGLKAPLTTERPFRMMQPAFIVTAKDGRLSDIVSLKNGELRNVSFGSDTQWGVAKLSINVEK